MTGHADRFRVARLVSATVAALCLGWLIVTHTYAFYAATRDGEGASYSSANGGALAERAIRAFDRAYPAPAPGGGNNPGKSAIEAEALRGLVDALRATPLDPRLLRRLGQLENDGGRQEKAEALMREAVRQSRQETVAVIWLLQVAHAQRNFKDVADHADTLLRTRRAAFSFAFAVLAQLSADAETRGDVVRLLAADPPWRKDYFENLEVYAGEPRPTFEVVRALRGSATPPREREMAAHLTFLVRRGAVDLAYYAWLDSLPPDRLATVGLLNNGNFEQPSNPTPFDWSLAKGSGGGAEIVPHPDGAGGRALSVIFSFGRVEFGGVSQTTVLGPGSYRLSGRLRGELKGRRGLEWQVTCTGAGGARLGQSPMFVGTARTWSAFDATFDVPATGCASQTVSLVLAARSASEQLVTGEVLYDNLKIEAVRVPAR